MRHYSSPRLPLVLAGLLALLPIVGEAQTIGTFRWQLLPYCNVVTLHIVQQGPAFALNGYDDQCGTAPRASVVGTAFVNPDGTIGVGFTTILAPTAANVHVDARISGATLGGPWRDSNGASGTFVFTPGAGSGGPERPLAPIGIAPMSVTGTHLAPGAVGSGHIAPAAVGPVQLAPGAVNAGHLAPASVHGSHLAAGAVTGAALADGSVTAAHLRDGPKLATTSTLRITDLLTAEHAATAHSLSLDIPTRGTVLVSAQASIVFGPGRSARCGLNTAPSVPVSPDYVYASGDTAVPQWIPVALTRLFTVDAGRFTVHLVCAAGMAPATVTGPTLTALFIPGS